MSNMLSNQPSSLSKRWMPQHAKPRTVTLKRNIENSFGFALESGGDNKSFRFIRVAPALHKLTRIIKNSPADHVGLKDGDYLIEINKHNVRNTPYRECVLLIQNTGDTLILQVISVTERPDIGDSSEQKDLITNSYLNIEHYLQANLCVYLHKVGRSGVDCSLADFFEIFHAYCDNPLDGFDPIFNTILDTPLDSDILNEILQHDQPGKSLTPFIIDSLQRLHVLIDIHDVFANFLEFSNKCENLILRLTNRLLLIIALESLSNDSQRFFCNIIQKNDLPIPFTYLIWNRKEKQIFHKINFNCLMETLCYTDRELLLQFGSPSAIGLGKTTMLGYICKDKRRESLFTDKSDQCWRDGCIDILFTKSFVILDIHGSSMNTNIQLLRSIQYHTAIQLVYITEKDLIDGDFLENTAMHLNKTRTIIIIFVSNYDDNQATEDLIKRFQDRYANQKWPHVVWRTVPIMMNVNVESQEQKLQLVRRNRRLRSTFENLLTQLNDYPEATFRSCFAIQSFFFKTVPSNTPVNVHFEIEVQLDGLFLCLSDQTENLLLITPISYLQSKIKAIRKQLSDAASNSDLITELEKYETMLKERTTITKYHQFMIDLFAHRSYIELLIVEKYIDHWQISYSASLREQKQMIIDNHKNTNTNQQILTDELLDIDKRLLNVDLTIGLFSDELFALWDIFNRVQPSSIIEQYQNQFDAVATRIAQLVYKGLAIHILRGRPLSCQSSLMETCIKKLNVKGPLAVLTVVGEQSSAKSSLLNSLFGCNFRVNAGRCTIGMYLGIAYHKNMTIIILDTEGLLSLEECGSLFDNQMVTMAILSSNLVIFNHKGELNSNLENLINMSLNAKMQIESSPFQSRILFVLRDQTQPDKKLFQQQLNKLKSNLQLNTNSVLKVSIDNEFDIQHIILLPSAFTEDINTCFDIKQKWRTQTFPTEITHLRRTILENLHAHIEQSEIIIKNFDYLYGKLTINWKSIDQLGQSLLECRTLYELSIQNELKSIAHKIIIEQQQILQQDAIQLIKNLHIKSDENSSILKPYSHIKESIEQGKNELRDLTLTHTDKAQDKFTNQTQNIISGLKQYIQVNIQTSIGNTLYHLISRLEDTMWTTMHEANKIYFREDLLKIIQSQQSSVIVDELDKRRNELEIEIQTNLKEYKKTKKQIIESILVTYTTLIRTLQANLEKHHIYNRCPLFDYREYIDKENQFSSIYSTLSTDIPRRSTRTIDITASLCTKYSYLLSWFKDRNDTNLNERIMHIIINIILPHITQNINSLLLTIQEQEVLINSTIINNIIIIIDNVIRHELNDCLHFINSTELTSSLIFLSLKYFIDKIIKIDHDKYQLLLNEILEDLNLIHKQFLLHSTKHDTRKQAELFHNLLIRDIVSECIQFHKQKLLDDLYSTIIINYSQQLNIDELARLAYETSIGSNPPNGEEILQYIFDINHYYLEIACSQVEAARNHSVDYHTDNLFAKVTQSLRIMNEVIKKNECTNAYILYKEIVHKVPLIPDFHSSLVTEMIPSIHNPYQFKKFFDDFGLGINDVNENFTLVINETKDSFRRLASRTCIDLLSKSLGCPACCPGCGTKCELPMDNRNSGEHQHSSAHHLAMAFHGCCRDDEHRPNLKLCYQQWSTDFLVFDQRKYTPQSTYYAEHEPDWYADLDEKSRSGQGHSDNYPPIEQRRAWMAVRHTLIAYHELKDNPTYNSDLYPSNIISLPADFEVRWKSL